MSVLPLLAFACTGPADDAPRSLPCDTPGCDPACDADRDGYAAPSCGGSDCDDLADAVHPGRVERCGPEGAPAVDDDCDGLADALDPSLHPDDGVASFADADGDGFGSGPDLGRVCFLPARTASVDGDCDDLRSDVHPAATSACNGALDDDCDGVPDPDEADADADGITVCDGDCDDADPAVLPGALETCDERDEDCDALVDLDDPGVDLWTCDYCPDPVAYDPSVLVDATYNPCWFDPGTTLDCLPPGENTPTNGVFEHRTAYRSDLPPRPQLFLWIPPGWGGENWKILSWAAYAGYRAVSVTFPSTDIMYFCPADDDQCQYQVWSELTYGADTSPLVDVPRGNSLEARALALLGYLDGVEPAVGWGDFIDGDTLDWERVVVSAWSDGNTVGSVLAHDKPLHGVFYISGPLDVNEPDTPSFLLDPFATPTCAQYGIRHSHETYGAGIDRNWDTMQMIGANTPVDGLAPPFGGSHRFTSESWTGVGECTRHQGVASDLCMENDLLFPTYVGLYCMLAERDLATCP